MIMVTRILRPPAAKKLGIGTPCGPPRQPTPSSTRFASLPEQPLANDGRVS